jgi:hypothetical protein
MKTIPLPKGRHALVDDADFEWLSLFSWQLVKRPRGAGFNVMRFVRLKGPAQVQTSVQMAREIMCPRADQDVVRVNDDPLDFRRANLVCVPKGGCRRKALVAALAARGQSLPQT